MNNYITTVLIPALQPHLQAAHKVLAPIAETAGAYLKTASGVAGDLLEPAVSAVRPYAQPYLAPLEPHWSAVSAQLSNLTLSKVRTDVNVFFKGFKPFEMILISLVIFFVLLYVLLVVDFVVHNGIFGPLRKWFFRQLRKLPLVKNKIASEGKKLEDSLAHLVNSKDYGQSYSRLPAKGLDKKELVQNLKQWSELDAPKWNQGKVSGTVYHGGEELTQVISQAFNFFALSNPLHSDLFPAVRKMEAEVIQMVVNMYNGDSEVCGSMTSGGTESILMACKTYRDWAKDTKDITEPEIIIPVTAHAAFDKAGEYFGIKIVKVPVNQKTFRAELKYFKKAYTSNTIAVVVSCPQFPQGTIDPVEEVATWAKSKNIGCHVDACLGGFLVPFMEKAGFPLPRFDFRVAGVTTISCDTHKYGFAPKGSSVVMYRNRALRHYQYFVCPTWTGGIYACPAVAGSRPGALVAGAWAALMYMGESGYVEETKKIIQASKRIEEGINKLTKSGLDVHVVGEPQVSVVAFGSKKLNVYSLSTCLSNRGWNLNSLQSPACIHICVTRLSAPMADKFLEDLKASVQEVTSNPAKFKGGDAAIYGMAASIPDKSMIGDVAKFFIDTMYKVGDNSAQH